MKRKFTFLLMALLALAGFKSWGQNYEYTLVTSLPSTLDPNKEYVLGYQDGSNYYFHSSGESANQMVLSTPSENTKVYKFVKDQNLYSAKCGDKYLKINNTYVSLDSGNDNFIKIYNGVVNDYNEMFQVYNDGNVLKAYCEWYMSLPTGAHLISFFERTGGAPTYTVTVTSDTEGCTASADKASYEEGETVTLSYEADAFHYFTGYESSDVTITGSTFAMPANNVSVTAHFTAKPTHSITATVNPEGAGTASVTYQSSAITEAPAGAVLNLSAVANPGFDFVSWTIGGEVISTNANYNYTMPDNDVVIVANFGEHQLLHVNIDPNIVGGTITVNPSECDPGTTVTVTANAASGYQYVYGNITVTDAYGQPVYVSQGNPNSTFTMPSTDVTVSATFSVSYSISIGSHQHCTVSTSPMGSATANAFVTVLVTPEEGYRVTNVTATYEGGEITAVYSGEWGGQFMYDFTMPAADVTVNVVCAQTYTVSYTQPTGGYINVSPTSYVPEGQEVSIDITIIYDHYSFDSDNYTSKISVKDASENPVTVNKEDNTHYNFSMPASNVTVSVTFDEDANYNIAVNQPEGCTIQVSPSENVYTGETVYLSYYGVQPGYQFVEWVVTDGESAIELYNYYGTYYFIMPASEDVTVTATVQALTAHTVNIAEGITGGSISAHTDYDYETPINAYAGEYVYLTNTPEPGYQFISYTVTSECETVEVYNNFYFYMPNCDVTVSATFIKPETLTVFGNGGPNDNNSIYPVYTFWGDTYGTTSQFIIPAEELEDMVGGTIKGMKFFIYSGGQTGNQIWECRIKEVDDKALTGIVDVSTLTPVYSGHYLSFANNEWNVTFDTPFAYSGKNLLVSFQCTTEGSYKSNSFHGENVDYYASWSSREGGSTFIPKTEFTYFPDPTAVFYDVEIAQVEGGTITASKTRAKADTEIELSVNLEEGYTFSRWIVKDADNQDVTVTDNIFTMPASDVTVTAEYNALPRYNVSLDPEMTNGTLLVNDDEPDENGYLAGKVITISDNPSIGYKFDTEYGVKAWKAGEPETEVTVTPSFSIEMPEYDIVISARFTELTPYTITYHVNGIVTEETVYENERIYPTTPATPVGTSFIGWATSDIATYNTTAPTLFQTGNYPTDDLDLYAVFHYADQSKWAKVTTNSQLNANGGDRVIFVDDVNLGKVMCDRTAGYNYYFNDGNVEIEYNPQTYRYEIASLPTNAVIFTTEKSGDNWKFHYTDVESWIGETTLSCYGGSNINPSNWGGNDNWSINAGYVYNIGYNNCYLAYDRVNNRFKSSEYDWAHMYIEVLPQGSLDAYFTEVFSVSGSGSMNEDMEARNLLINEGASYTVNGGKLTVLGFIKNIENTPANFIFTDGAQLITDNTGVLATMKKHINGTEWYTISSPLAESVNVTDVTNLIPTTVSATDYDLYRLNEALFRWENARPETNQEPAFTTIDKGVGYIYSNNAGADYIAFAGEINVEDVECTLTKDAGHGFNLIGNPFSQNITLADVAGTAELAEGYYVLSNENTWGAMIETGTIAPLQSFLVQATAGGAATISKSASTSKGERSNEQNTNIEVIVSNSNYRDNAYAMFGEGIGLNKVNHRNAEAPMVYIPQGGEDFAIAFMDENTTLFPVSFKAMTTGKYSISLKATEDVNTLVLIDNQTGVETNMLLEESYSFIGSPADRDNRFTVKLGISQNNGQNDDEHFVYQYGNELVIDGEGMLQVFDVLGRVVISEEVHGQRVNIGSLIKGAYIVRMTGENVMTQKIIVK